MPPQIHLFAKVIASSSLQLLHEPSKNSSTTFIIETVRMLLGGYTV
jgi:hypothetical protein